MKAWGKPKPGSWSGLVVGILVLLLGCAVFRLFHPSPHGYGEIFVAVPLMAVGSLILGLSLLVGWRTLGWVLRLVAVIAVLAGLRPIGLLFAIVLGL